MFDSPFTVFVLPFHQVFARGFRIRFICFLPGGFQIR